MKKAFTSRENNSFHLVHEIIEAEFREAFRIRLTKDEQIAVALNNSIFREERTFLNSREDSRLRRWMEDRSYWIWYSEV